MSEMGRQWRASQAHAQERLCASEQFTASPLFDALRAIGQESALCADHN